MKMVSRAFRQYSNRLKRLAASVQYVSFLNENCTGPLFDELAASYCCVGSLSRLCDPYVREVIVAR